MKAPAEKTAAKTSDQARHGRTNARLSSQHATSQSTSTEPLNSSFVDRRPVAAKQRKLQALANNSPHVKRLQAIQEMANKDPRTEHAPTRTPLGGQTLPGPVQGHENSKVEEPNQEVAEAVQVNETKNSHSLVADLGSEPPPVGTQSNASPPAPKGSARPPSPISNSSLQRKGGQTATPVIQMEVAAAKLKELFGLPGVKTRAQFHSAIGKDAFDHFKKMVSEADLTPLVGFFKDQRLPIQNPVGQWNLLVPHVSDDDKLDVVKLAIKMAKFDTAVADPISVYLLKYLAQSEHKLRIAKSVLAEKDNDPNASEAEMQVIEGNVEKTSGREAFKREYKRATGQEGDVNRRQAKKLSVEKIKDLTELFSDQEPKFNTGTKTADKAKNVEKINKAREARLEVLDEKEARINELIANFAVSDPGTKAINWCLQQANDKIEDLSSLIGFVTNSIDASILFSELETLVVGKEKTLWQLINGVESSARGELPAPIKRMTLPGLAEIFTKASQDWAKTKGILAAVKIGEEKEFSEFLKTWETGAIEHLVPLLQRFDLTELTALKQQGDGAKLGKLFITDGLDAAATKTLLTKPCKDKIVEWLGKVPKPALLVKLEAVSGGAIDQLERMVDQLNASNHRVNLVEASFRGDAPADSMLKAAVAGNVTMRDTPSGKITPETGPLSGVEQKYGDSRNKHTKLGLYNPDEIAAGIRRQPASYGSQLSKTATDNYSDLVKDALENGNADGSTKYTHTADYKIGVNVVSRSETNDYTIHRSDGYGGWHVFPS